VERPTHSGVRRGWGDVQLHELKLAQLHAAVRPDLSRSIADSSHLRALKGGDHTGPQPGRWLHAVKRLRVRYERRADIHQALIGLACSMICLRQLIRTDL